MKKFIELFGWYGVMAIIIAYALVSFSVLQPTDVIFQGLNASGALGIVLVSYYKRAYQPAILNIIWLIIALTAIVRVLF